MRPVNLIPESQRSTRPSGERSGSAYAVLGVLGLLLVGVVMYVVTSNQVNTRKEQTMEAKRDADAAEAKVKSLGGFGSFSGVAEARVSSVETLANGRFDWERLLREIAHVLPSGTWLRELDATAAPSDESGATATNTTLSSTASGPQAKLVGCANHQGDVAKLMVRLRRMHRVEDVGLTESARGEQDSLGTSGGATTCGKELEFELTVAFVPGTESAAGERKRVPASLGGGP